MNERVSEWVAKAEGDFQVALRELDARPHPNFDAVCFHAQQCVEKLMKAVLIQAGREPPKIHGLIELDTLVRSVRPDWRCERHPLRFLTRGAIAFRYPGESAEGGHAEMAVRFCGKLREDLLSLLD